MVRNSSNLWELKGDTYAANGGGMILSGIGGGIRIVSVPKTGGADQPPLTDAEMMNNTAIYIYSKTDLNIGNNKVVQIYGKLELPEVEVKLASVGSMKSDTIRANQLTLDMPNAADYVFDPSYTLRSLDEVEEFVNTNKHLPGMPSAAEFKENGVNMAEMNNLLLEKVEELTLYTIEMNKRLQTLEAENQQLKQAHNQ